METNKLSSALIKLRFALLNGDSAGAVECLTAVKTANLELSTKFRELNRLIDSAANQIENLLNLGEVEHACALADAIHAIPEIVDSHNANIREFRKCFIKPFAKKWNDDFFDNFDLKVIFKK